MLCDLCTVGKPKEAQARSCHQEVVRQSKAVLAAYIPAASSGSCGSARNSANGSMEDAQAVGSSSSSSPVPLSGGAAAAANGYLAAAELALHLKLPALAGQLLELAAGVLRSFEIATAAKSAVVAAKGTAHSLPSRSCRH
jgi:hypothetical protein